MCGDGVFAEAGGICERRDVIRREGFLVLFPEIAGRYTETRLLPEQDFGMDLADLVIPEGTTLAVIVNPSNPNGGFHARDDRLARR